MFKVILINLFVTAFAQRYYCSRESALNLFKRPSYEFSVRILDNVAQQTDGHFVFSPLSTWLQLMTLAEGAQASTLNELWNVVKHHRVRCFRRKLREIINIMDKELKFISNRSSVFIVNKFFNVKNSFKNEVEKLNGLKMLSLNFDDPDKAAAEANAVIKKDMGGKITEVVYPSDFNLTVLLMADVAYFNGDWKYPFNRAYTRKEPFYSDQGFKIGNVKMMSQVGYFNLVDIPLVNLKVLELCSVNDRASMLVFLPDKGSIHDIYFSLKAIRLSTIFNLFKQKKPQLVNVKLPRFKIHTEIDSIPELIYDMGVKRIFHPHLANLSGISDYKLYVSLMSQIADIKVTEEGITAKSVAEFLAADNNTVIFNANHPFAF